MIQLRKSQDRGHTKLDWLDSYHTFSFAEFHDPRFTHFHTLRVINEDWIEADSGFGMHAHQDMEIITYVLKGTLTHTDSLGNHFQIKAGEFQRMSAGSGIMHSEMNQSKTERVHLFQMWVFPDTKNLTPGYEQKTFPVSSEPLVRVASNQPKSGELVIHQNAELYVGRFKTNQTLNFKLGKNRYSWIQVAQGKLTVNQNEMQTGDGFAVSEEEKIDFKSQTESEILFWNLGS